MTGVDIADVDPALGKVRDFIKLPEQNHTAWEKKNTSSGANVHYTDTACGLSGPTGAPTDPKGTKRDVEECSLVQTGR
jgi:hypothetical protein